MRDMSVSNLKRAEANLELCKKELDELYLKMNRGKQVEDSRVQTLRDKNNVLKILINDKIEEEVEDSRDYLKSKVKDIIFKNIKTKTERSLSRDRKSQM